MPRFITRKWIEVHDQSGGVYSINKQIRFKTPMLKSDFCDTVMHTLLLKGLLLLQIQMMLNIIRN